jgi:hypothetical protein
VDREHARRVTEWPSPGGQTLAAPLPDDVRRRVSFLRNK